MLDNKDRLFAITAGMLAIVHAFFMTFIGFHLVDNIMRELRYGDDVDSLSLITITIVLELLVAASATIFVLLGYVTARR